MRAAVPRRVDLPAFLERPDAIPLEVLGQSLLDIQNLPRATMNTLAPDERRRPAPWRAPGMIGLVIAVESSNLIVLDARHANDTVAVFKDPIHLDRRGASILSTDLAGILARDAPGAFGGPRWIELPQFLDRPLDAPLEDSIQTVLALRAVMSSGGRK